MELRICGFLQKGSKWISTTHWFTWTDIKYVQEERSPKGGCYRMPNDLEDHSFHGLASRASLLSYRARSPCNCAWDAGNLTFTNPFWVLPLWNCKHDSSVWMPLSDTYGPWKARGVLMSAPCVLEYEFLIKRLARLRVFMLRSNSITTSGRRSTTLIPRHVTKVAIVDPQRPWQVR